MTNYHYWQYFLNLETDLINTSRYIEFTGVNDSNVVNNTQTFSTELLRIFLAVCAECENTLKIILAKENSSVNNIKGDIKKKQQAIMNISTYRELPNQTIDCPAYSLNFTPWTAWNTPENPPQWWKDHNDVKHGRANDIVSNYHLANLSNTLTSTAALMCLLFEYYKKPVNENEGENVIKYHVSLPPVFTPKLFIPKKSGLGFGNINWVWQP
ncbi:hypothetical protein QT970_20355 [Microcoleus sp. herbarium8]|uniref:hypothetical protein n=1 Tax=Microcoleus sp. herbarium8 TaxID=3055436 RepID=UPI002FD298FD